MAQSDLFLDKHVTIASISEYITNLIQSTGSLVYGVVFIIVFLESFPITFFLPGESMLFTGGFLASQGHMNLLLLIIIILTSSILGYVLAYEMGGWLRELILKSNDRYWFKRKHLEYTENFYKKYGHKAVIIGRFVPIARSFVPTLAGAAKMNRKTFLTDVLVGGLLWSVGVTAVGFYLGNIIPNAEKLFTPIIVLIVFISVLPAFIEYWGEKSRKNNTGKE